MAKTLQQSTENYIRSIPKAMQNYKLFLINKKRISNNDTLAKQTVDYGIQMLHSGVGENTSIDDVIEIFREQAIICNTLKDYCKEFLKK